MMKIRTVICPIDRASEFDKAVNMLLKDGWRMTERKLIAAQGEPHDAGGYTVIQALYAHMEIHEPHEEITI